VEAAPSSGTSIQPAGHGATVACSAIHMRRGSSSGTKPRYLAIAYTSRRVGISVISADFRSAYTAAYACCG
jgi:hypothetical protein